MISFAGGLPANELLPRDELSVALADVSHDDEALQYGWPEGGARLRRWIADRLTSRGGPVIDPDRVVVTAGAQQALSLAAEYLASCAAGTHVQAGYSAAEPRIAVGDATYAGALDAFRAAGLLPAVDRGRVRYAIAGVSNPHGVELVEREELVRQLVADQRRVVICDEAYVDLRFDGRVDPPLLADDRGAGRRLASERDRRIASGVWHVGTFSKTLCPGVRVGWLIPPIETLPAILERKQAIDLQTASMSQAVVARLLELIDYDELVSRARRHYAERAAIAIAAVRRHVRGIRFADPEGGFSLWIETDALGDDVALLAQAISEGVAFDPGSLFRPDPAGDRRAPLALRVTYSNVPLARIDEGARRLGRVLDRWRSEHRRAA